MPQYAGVKVVHQGAADNVSTFNTIADAIAAIADASASNRYAVLVMPGVYVGGFTTKDFVDVVGQSRSGAVAMRSWGAKRGCPIDPRAL